jgi:hypothetical protein
MILIMVFKAFLSIVFQGSTNLDLVQVLTQTKSHDGSICMFYLRV